MWIKAQNGNVYRREAFYTFEVETTEDAGIKHNFLRARLKPPEAHTLTSGLKSIDPNAIVLGDYRTERQARQALSRLFPERRELVDLTIDPDLEGWRDGC